MWQFKFYDWAAVWAQCNFCIHALGQGFHSPALQIWLWSQLRNQVTATIWLVGNCKSGSDNNLEIMWQPPYDLLGIQPGAWDRAAISSVAEAIE